MLLLPERLTMTDYLKLAEPPGISYRAPVCDACLEELDWDGDSLRCPTCGTSWSEGASDGDAGDLYEQWSGETLEGPTIENDYAYLAASELMRKLRGETQKWIS